MTVPCAQEPGPTRIEEVPAFRWSVAQWSAQPATKIPPVNVYSIEVENALRTYS